LQVSHYDYIPAQLRVTLRFSHAERPPEEHLQWSVLVELPNEETIEARFNEKCRASLGTYKITVYSTFDNVFLRLMSDSLL